MKVKALCGAMNLWIAGMAEITGKNSVALYLLAGQSVHVFIASYVSQEYF